MNNTDILKRLYNDYTKNFLSKIALSVFFSLIVAASTSSIAWLLDPAIKKIFILKDQSLILLIPGLIIVAFAAKGISLYLAKVIMIGVAEDVRKNIQVDMLKSLIQADTSIIDNKHSGKFVSNLTYDTGLITNLLSTAILNLFKDSLTLIGLLSVMFYQNWKLSLIAIIMIPLATLAARTLGKRIGKVSTEAQAKSGELTAYLMEINNELDINNFFSFLAAMMLAYQPVRSLATLNMSVNQGLSSAKRILPIIDIKNEITDNKDSVDLNLSNCKIKFTNCNFKYNKSENLILKNLNMEISGGKMTALVGHSGAGKSSILNLIPRFYDCNSGDITIDGQSIYSVKIEKLRNNISIVTQDTTLFDDTIKNNILYANINATDEEIKEAAEKSFADEFIKDLPKKYDTLIGENGIRLSGGEKQRLSIARAMLKKTPIILLDEATSSLDAETENKIQQAINLLTKNKTTIVIAHRLSTILNSNKIFVIDNGKISSEGTHEELLEKSSIYKNFYEKQIRKD